MEADLLGHIIQLEKRLQKQLERETTRAEAWKTRELGELDRQLDAAELAARAIDQATLNQAKAAIEAEGQQLLETIRLECAQLANLEQTSLIALLTRQLQSILPEPGHDH